MKDSAKLLRECETEGRLTLIGWKQPGKRQKAAGLSGCFLIIRQSTVYYAIAWEKKQSFGGNRIFPCERWAHG